LTVNADITQQVIADPTQEIMTDIPESQLEESVDEKISSEDQVDPIEGCINGLSILDPQFDELTNIVKIIISFIFFFSVLKKKKMYRSIHLTVQTSIKVLTTLSALQSISPPSSKTSRLPLLTAVACQSHSPKTSPTLLMKSWMYSHPKLSAI
jgi:hypothetical protein